MISKIKSLTFLTVMYLTFFYVWVLRLLAPLLHVKREKDVLYLEAFTRDGAGYNYRVHYWKQELENTGLKVDTAFIFEYADEFFKYANQPTLQPFLSKGIRIRIKQILQARHYKAVIVRRNLMPYNQYGNHYLEKLLVAVNPNCILDFDDDIGAQETTLKSNFDRLLLATNQQFYGSFQFFKAFVVGSHYLSDLVLLHQPNTETIVVPTCVNYTSFEQKKYDRIPPTVTTFGWIGGNHNLFLLKKIVPALNRVAQKYSIRLLVIAGVDNYDFGAEFPVEFIPFSLETEKEYLRKMDIGLMPLLDDQVSKGKCGFKLLQYMGLGVPGIASAVTINTEIIEHGQNGWLVDPNMDWYETLMQVLEQQSTWAKIGARAHETVDTKYSFKANAERYVEFINKHLPHGN